MSTATADLTTITRYPDLRQQVQACAQAFPFTKRGETLMRQLRAARGAAQENFRALQEADGRGGATTDEILRLVLPHANTAANRAADAWITHRSPLTADVRVRYQARNRAPLDWDVFARELWDFVTGVITQPDSLTNACAHFADLPYTKGFQAGLLSPILHALAPQSFTLVNPATLRLLVRYMPGKFTGALRDYPAVNRVALDIAAAIADALPPGALASFAATDWLYFLAEWTAHDVTTLRRQGPRSWRVNQPDDATWRNWVTDGFIALPIRVEPGMLRDGDIVVAHHSGRVMRGYGRVNGSAFSVPHQPDHWRWPVVWEDTTPTPITQSGWRTSFASLSARVVAELPLAWRDGDVAEDILSPISFTGVIAETPTPYTVTPTTSQGNVTSVTSPYTLADCAAETHYTVEQLRGWVEVIRRKGQAIIAGPPGTGKTFLAERLARLIGNPAANRTLQLHPGYSYEDFMQGVRPQTAPDGSLWYNLTPGHFLTFCAQARMAPGEAALVLDEINRAPLTQVLGEALYLLEYRDQPIDLAAGGTFSIPANVRIIGTMNTADRTALPLDHALRRRFAWIPLAPDYHVLHSFLIDIGYKDAEKLVSLLKRLNRSITDPNMALGISYFLRPSLAADLPDIWRYEVEPYLAEVWFDQPALIGEYQWDAVRRALEPKPAKRSR